MREKHLAVGENMRTPATAFAESPFEAGQVLRSIAKVCVPASLLWKKTSDLQKLASDGSAVCAIGVAVFDIYIYIHARYE